MPITLEQAALDFRAKIELFTSIPDADWAMILPHLELKKIKKHVFFAEEGKRAYDIGFVVEGMFRHFYTKDGEEKTTYFYFENHFITSYISCITGQPSQLTIEALSDASYLSLPYKVLADLFEKSMAWQRFGRLIAEYLAIGLEERMVSLLTQSPEERYMDLLQGNKKKIIERIPQHYIATYLGITPVSMSRIRNRLLKKS
ncbi:MAG: Crp/Fnr family transcriptional regulator [Bacteroidota bacterium]